jgi:integrase
MSTTDRKDDGLREGADGRWSFVLSVTGGDGRRRQVRRRGFVSKREAKAEIVRLRETMSGGRFAPTVGRLKIGTYLLDTWLPIMSQRVRPTTADTYARLVRVHLVRDLGAIEVRKLDRPTVARWVASLSSRGLSPKSVKNIHAVLTKALTDAQELGLVGVNVASGIGLPSVPLPPPRAWTAVELNRFLSGVSGDRWAPLWRLLATTGMRRGEALGLRWADIDLSGSTLTICRQRTIAGGSVVEGVTKSAAGARTITLDAGTVTALLSWRKQQVAERLVMGAGWPKHDLLWCWADGRPLWPQTITADLRRYALALELEPIGVHGLRHSAATWMIAQGLSPKMVAQRLGHDVRVTLTRYAHVAPGDDVGAATAFAKAIDGTL